MTKNLADVAVAIVKLPVGNSDAPGGVLAWQNPEGVAIVVTGILAYVTITPTDPGHDVEVGVAADGTAASDTITGHQNLGIAGAVFILANAAFVLQAAEWVTASTVAGSVAGLAGSAYVYYHVA